ncbi:flavin reductase family protein [Persicobacter psychrovividus]|uniref:Flavin reductase n=1 Tax=Persicobacter psychrovividus TaxID=387638 RepID=A0ABM7VCZ6_9BACT|nr:flavin reductase [Persicobacter psychrovividus]
MIINPKEQSIGDFHRLMLSAVVPRPIAFVSTIDANGHVNLSPFSFFNAFGANPPILAFSPARRVRDNTTKHTLENVLEVPECVIHIVNGAIVEQMSLSSSEYDEQVNEFLKSGLTEKPSTMVKPPIVQEAPVAFECKVQQVVDLGGKKGSGNLVICEVLVAHVREGLLQEDGLIDPLRLDPMARMGGNLYSKVNHDSLFTIQKPGATLGIGVDQLPDSVRLSRILTGNELAILAGVAEIPKMESDTISGYQRKIEKMAQNHTEKELVDVLHSYVKRLLAKNKVQEAWQMLLLFSAQEKDI